MSKINYVCAHADRISQGDAAPKDITIIFTLAME
jgi:hypothetical protein